MVEKPPQPNSVLLLNTNCVQLSVVVMPGSFESVADPVLINLYNSSIGLTREDLSTPISGVEEIPDQAMGLRLDTYYGVFLYSGTLPA